MEASPAVFEKEQLLGLSLFSMTQKLNRLGYSLGEIQFRESRLRRLSVLDLEVNPETKRVDVLLAGVNPIRHLPAIYQKNEFLREYLWLFQHTAYEVTGILDNIHSYFTPVEAPLDFVKWLATWFGMRLDFSDNEDRMRTLLQFAVPLYRWRGTSIGLRKLLLLFTGYEPQILENEMPYEAFTIMGETEVSAPILDTGATKVFFTVHFSVSVSRFDSGVIQKVTRIISLEKPAHTQFFLTFVEVETKERNRMVISNTLRMGMSDETTI